MQSIIELRNSYGKERRVDRGLQALRLEWVENSAQVVKRGVEGWGSVDGPGSSPCMFACWAISAGMLLWVSPDHRRPVSSLIGPVWPLFWSLHVYIVPLHVYVGTLTCLWCTSYKFMLVPLQVYDRPITSLYWYPYMFMIDPLQVYVGAFTYVWYTPYMFRLIPLQVHAGNVCFLCWHPYMIMMHPLHEYVRSLCCLCYGRI